MKKIELFLFILLAVIFTGCAAGEIVSVNEPGAGEPGVTAAVSEKGQSENAAEMGETAEAVEISEFLIKKSYIDNIMGNMSLDEKIGQMLMCSFESDENGTPVTEANEQMLETIKKYGIGGVIYFAANVDTSEQTAKLSSDIQRAGKIPLFIAVDEEGGRVSRITRSGKIEAETIPPAKTIGNTGDSNKAYEAAKTIAYGLVPLGINMNFAPCADLNSDNEGVIGDRAFSGDPVMAGEFVSRAVRGYNENGIMCAVKHFPGHGAAPGDTHEEGIISEKSLDEILEADIIPFVYGVNEGVPIIMMSHITLQEWGVPASMSGDAVNYIRNEMGFGGILITDSFRMGAITNYYEPGEAAVNAVKSGIDIVLMPEDVAKAAEGLKSAAESGEIPIERINEAVERILTLKYDYSLITVNTGGDR